MNRRKFIKSSIAVTSLLAAGSLLDVNCTSKRVHGNPIALYKNGENNLIDVGSALPV
ncbi:MAG TPA: hypothetical protein VGK25_02580 [Ignavibacteria bacterium]|jgi:hypothetical protein